MTMDASGYPQKARFSLCFDGVVVVQEHQQVCGGFPSGKQQSRAHNGPVTR